METETRRLPLPPKMPREWDSVSESVTAPEANPDFYYMYDAENNGIATKRPPAFMR